MKKIVIMFLFTLIVFMPFGVKADLTTDYNTQYNALEQQIINIKTQYYKDVTAIQGSGTYTERANGLIQKATNEANTKIEQIKLQEEQLYINYQTALNNQKIQQLACPINSYNSNGQCVCNSGYLASEGACITYDQSCQNKYGANSYGDQSNCYCNTGYQWNSSHTVCINIPPSVVIPPVSVKTPATTQKTTNPTSSSPQKITTEKPVQPVVTIQDTQKKEFNDTKVQTQSKPDTSNGIFSIIKNFFKNIFKF